MWFRGVLLAWGTALSLLAGEVRINGKVVDENQVVVPAARVWIEDRSTLSDHAGSFAIELDRAGDYKISAQREGYFVLRDRPLALAGGENLVTLVLNHQREVLDSVEVSYSPPAVNTEETAATQQLGNTEILGVPYPSTNNLKNTLPLLPGIVQDSRGDIHIQGGNSDQVYWSLDGFNINDPLTGRFESRLAIDGVRTIEVNSGRYSAETGKGSAGAVQIRTAMGGDRWRPSATNFFPGIENHKGIVFGDWTPRATLSGPLANGRAWLADSIDAQYHMHVVEELPAGQDRNRSWRSSNLLRSQVNLTASNIFSASWLVNYFNAPRSGLSFLDPMETTLDRRTRQNFFSFKDQAYFSSGTLVELGYATTRGFGRDIPQGYEPFVFTPDGKRGNYYMDSRRRSGRDQWLANVFLPSFHARGNHQLKTGVDFDRLTYYQKADRRAYMFERANGTISRRVDFVGDNEVRRKNFEASSYLQDRWKPWHRLLVDAGVRLDWDQILRQPVLSPRLGFSLAVPGLENTKLAAGFGVFHDASNLRVLARHLDQYALARYYSSDGQALVRGPTASVYMADERDLRVPVYHNWSLGVEHLFPWSLHGRFEYLRRRGWDGFTFVPTAFPGGPPEELLASYQAGSLDGLYVLRSLRRDSYDSFEVTVRKTFRRQAEWLASYTRSRALSNAVVDVNIDDPLLIENNAGRLPWDTPNRFMSWGIVPVTEKNSIAFLAEWRDGFLFNVTDEEGGVIGKVNERRLPFYFSVNLHWERKFRFHRQWWAWRGGFNNLTDRFNPTTVNNVAGSASFLRYSGGQHRAFVVRIRWLGKTGKGARL